MMIFLHNLSFLLLILTIKHCSSLICYQCNEIVITSSNLTTPSGCTKMNVDKIYCTITIVLHNNDIGYLNVESETAHQAFGYNEDFVLLGLTVKNNGSYEYGLTYHCLTDGCNEPKLNKIQLLLNSTTIDHYTNNIIHELYTITPEIPLICSNYTNSTTPDKCFSHDHKRAVCVTCVASIDGITNSVCMDCLTTSDLSTLLRDERAYMLKTRNTTNHNFELHCNRPYCNRMDSIERVKHLYRYNFDYDKFPGNSTSNLILYNKNIIFCFIFILFIWNKF
ncbi:unnamed protein product [Adineta steineri]|uniref:Uncharacterized protein n=1 Tax=Adineta steineri TaxID=433720 RepID=A0A818T621_9BILA|nr:unnamed protein product [Adineta steineri]